MCVWEREWILQLSNCFFSSKQILPLSCDLEGEVEKFVGKILVV